MVATSFWNENNFEMKISRCLILHLCFSNQSNVYLTSMVLEEAFWTFLGSKKSFFLRSPLKMDCLSTSQQRKREDQENSWVISLNVPSFLSFFLFSTQPTKYATKAILSGVLKADYRASTPFRPWERLCKCVPSDIYLWQFAIVRFFCSCY